MKIKLFTLIAVSVIPVGCGPLVVANSDRFRVTSEPSGAVVQVMGKEMGKTPLTLRQSDVFPLRYDAELTAHYGSVLIQHPGCEERRIPVNGGVLEKGITARLSCGQPPDAKHIGENSVEQRLMRLKQLRDADLVTQEEYRQLRTKILESL